MDTGLEGLPISQAEQQAGPSPDQPASKDKPPVKSPEKADNLPVDESGGIAEARARISELATGKKEPEQVAEQAGATEAESNKPAANPQRRSSIIGNDPYPYIPPVRAEETDNTPIVTDQDFQPEDFGRDYFHGTGMGSNYGKLRNGYRAYDNDRFWDSVVRAVKKYLPANAARVLEVGCAEGYLVKRLKKAGLREAIGIDTSPTVLEEAKRVVSDARFEEVNLNRDNFNPALNGTFDAITAMDVLEHTAHRVAPDGTDISGVAHVVPKLVALLKKDGVFMMSAPVQDRNLVSRIVNFFDSDKTHISKLPTEEYLKILEQNGLEVMEKRHLFLVPWFRVPFLPTALEIVAKKK